MAKVTGIVYPDIDTAIEGWGNPTIVRGLERVMCHIQRYGVVLIALSNSAPRIIKGPLQGLLSRGVFMVGDWRCCFYGHHLVVTCCHEEYDDVACVSCGGVIAGTLTKE